MHPRNAERLRCLDLGPSLPLPPLFQCRAELAARTTVPEKFGGHDCRVEVDVGSKVARGQATRAALFRMRNFGCSIRKADWIELRDKLRAEYGVEVIGTERHGQARGYETGPAPLRASSAVQNHRVSD